MDNEFLQKELKTCYRTGWQDAINFLTQKLHSAISNRGCADLHDIINEEAEALKAEKPLDLMDEIEVREAMHDN